MKIPLLYKWVHYKLLEQKQPILSAKCIISIVRRNIRLPPNQLHYEILKELETYKLIIKVNRKMGYRILQHKLIVIDPFF